MPKLTVSEHSEILIRGGRVIDPVSRRDEVADVAIVDGAIAASPRADARVVDASGWIVCPGLMDLHVHLREPGQVHKETIETGTAAAAAAGFTFVACMPNTSPPLDEPESIRFVLDRARQAAHCEVAPIASITRGRSGDELTDFAALLEAGAVALSDDGDGVENDTVMLEAFERAEKLDALLIQHCEHSAVSAGGVMHKGEVSLRVGLPGLDPRSEESMVERDIELCRRTGGRYHVAHVSTAKTVELVRRARRDGLPVTSEVCTHHLLLTDEACAGADPNTKMHPPLRPMSDVEACRRGLIDGTIDCIVTDHAPHTAAEKGVGFLEAPAGVVGLETALGVAAEAMIATGLADWPQLIAWLTAGPSRVLKRRHKEFAVGKQANLTLIDPNARRRVDAALFHSKGRNTPFQGRDLVGWAAGTLREGRLTLSDGARLR